MITVLASAKGGSGKTTLSTALSAEAARRGVKTLLVDADTQARLTRIFQRGVEAYRVLSVSETRAAYDLSLAKGELRLERGAATRVDTGARSLDEVCRSPGAKLYAKRAEDLIAMGELEKATNELYRALRAEEGENPELLERIHAVTALARLGTPK